jgi:anti-anti-sigma regulatory factor
MSYVRYFKRMVIDVQDDGAHVLHLGEIEIWDGADLALLREGLANLIEKDEIRSIIIDMQFVKYIPSGFFGMLFDWYERRSVAFSLTPPQPNVQRMLWFRQFFRMTDDGLYELHPEPLQPMLAGSTLGAHLMDADDDEDDDL